MKPFLKENEGLRKKFESKQESCLKESFIAKIDIGDRLNEKENGNTLLIVNFSNRLQMLKR